MDDGIATPAQMITALDRWARARGMLWEDVAHDDPTRIPGLRLLPSGSIAWMGHTNPATWLDLPPEIVLAWALIHEHGDGTIHAEAFIWLRAQYTPGENFFTGSLAVRADSLLSAGDPLGEILTWLLTLWSASPPDLRHTADAAARLEQAANRHYWSGPLGTAETMWHLPESHPAQRSERAMMAIQLARRTPWTQIDAMHVVDAWYKHAPAATLGQWADACSGLGLDAAVAAVQGRLVHDVAIAR